MAIERGYEYYFWGHSDVAVLGKDESASFADDVIACVEASYRSRPSWGIIYFNYDWFSAIRTDLVRQVRDGGNSARSRASHVYSDAPLMMGPHAKVSRTHGCILLLSLHYADIFKGVNQNLCTVSSLPVNKQCRAMK